MVNLLIVGVGGFVGSVMRYLLSGWVHRITDTGFFPYGTLVVNIFGCFLIGFFAGLAETQQTFTPETRLFLFLGVLGGFTTFSTFGYETFSLARNGEFLASAANIIFQIILGLAAVWLGNYLTQKYF